MMILEEAIRAHLIANGGVTTTVGDRVYPLKLPQKPTYPAIRVARISNVPEHSHGGPSGLATTRIQIDCFADTALAAKKLGEAVKLALDPFQGTMGGDGGVEVDACFLEDSRDDEDDDLKVYWASLDFMFVHAEARA